MASGVFVDFRNMFSGGIFRRALNVVRRPFWNYAFLNNKSPVSIDTERLLDVYQSCPQLATVINKKGEMLANGVLKARNKASGEDIPKHWALDFMRTPNPIQSFKSFTYQYSIYFDIYQNEFIYRNLPFGRPTERPITIWNLPPEFIRVVPTGKWLDQISISGVVDRYEMYGAGSKPVRDFNTDEVLHLHEGISRTNMKSESKFIALQLHISNCIGALKTRNIFIYYGPKQIISSDAKDNFGVQKISPDERKKIEAQFNKEDYGINDSQSHTVIASSAIKVDQLSYPTKDLMLFEECEDGIEAFCGAYGIKRDILPSDKGATFENQEEAEKSTYYGTIYPCALTYCSFLEKVLNVEPEVELYMDYEHLPVLQADKLITAQGDLAETQRLSLMWKDGIISAERYAELAGEDKMTGDGVVKQTIANKITTDPNADPSAQN